MKIPPLVFAVGSLLASALPAATAADSVEQTIRTSGKVFLGVSAFTVQRIFAGGGGRDIITACNGHGLAFHNHILRASADGGANWQVSGPFPVFGSGEATLAKLSGGRILSSSREPMSKNHCFFGWSYDGGQLWIEPFESDGLPDGARGKSSTCLGDLIRLPIAGAGGAPTQKPIAGRRAQARGCVRLHRSTR